MAQQVLDGDKQQTNHRHHPCYCCRWDRKYWTTYKVLDILQKVFYRSNPAREAFVEMCEDSYVQKMTFDSYLYKTVVPGWFICLLLVVQLFVCVQSWGCSSGIWMRKQACCVLCGYAAQTSVRR